MNRLKKYIAAAGLTSLLCGCLCGCDEVFIPVDEGDASNPYLYWNETVEPTTTEETTVPEEEGVIGYVTGKFLNIRSGPGTEYETLGTLTLGNQVRIYEQRTVDGTVWGLTETGWVSMSYITLEANGTSVVGTITAKSLNIRSGPGTAYDTAGTLSKGDQVIILEQTTVDGKTWGRIDSGWISMQYVTVEVMGSTTSTAVVTGKTLNIRAGAGTGYDVVGTLSRGDEVTILEQTTVGGKEWGRIEDGWISMDYVEITGTVTTPVEDEPQNVVSDTTIVGSWISMDEQGYFSGSDPSPATWTFREDGTYSCTTCEYTHMEKIGWQGASGGSEKNGTYTFDGSTLTMTSSGETVTMNISITNNTMEVYGHRTYSLMLRTYDVNALIKTLIRNTYSASDSSIHGSWTSINTATYTEGTSMECSKWYFGTDGSFSESLTGHMYDAERGWYPASGSTVYSGYYFYDGARLTLCYETATNGSTWETENDVRYVIFDNVTVSGSTIDLREGDLFFAKTDDVNSAVSKMNG